MLPTKPKDLLLPLLLALRLPLPFFLSFPSGICFCLCFCFGFSGGKRGLQALNSGTKSHPQGPSMAPSVITPPIFPPPSRLPLRALCRQTHLAQSDDSQPPCLPRCSSQRTPEMSRTQCIQPHRVTRYRIGYAVCARIQCARVKQLRIPAARNGLTQYPSEPPFPHVSAK